MTRLIRRLLAVVLAAGTVLGASIALAPPGSAAGAGAVVQAAVLRGAVLDGVLLRHLPAGLGTSTDFAYEYDDVQFAARVWESGSDATGWRVDLAVDVLRGDRLTDGAALHDWFVAYEERPPGAAHYRPVRVRGHRGWLTRDEIFWLARPGVAIAMRLDVPRWSTRELVRTARGARLLPAGAASPGRCSGRVDACSPRRATSRTGWPPSAI
jgi:hypothetical protein